MFSNIWVKSVRVGGWGVAGAKYPPTVLGSVAAEGWLITNIRGLFTVVDYSRLQTDNAELVRLVNTFL